MMTKSHDLFLSHLAQTSPYPIGLEVDRAVGIYLHTKDGRKYLDLISGIAVNNVGHCHPKIIKAIQDQLEKHLHVMAYGEYIQESVNRLAENLSKVLPDSLNCSYFVNSGTEATEGAVKLAKRHTHRTEIVSFLNSYHGNTMGSLSVSGNEQKKYAFRPLIPGTKFLPYNDIPALTNINRNTAAVIVEPVQGDAGVILPTEGFLQAIRSRCSETGALLIFDEIQTGFGRTGRLFAFEHFGVVPDILTLAKAMGGGLPLGAFISDRKIMESLTHDPVLGHITTFGGNPVCCAAANAVLEILSKPAFLEEIEPKGKLFEELLSHTTIKAIRRIGLMLAVEFDRKEIVEKVVRECLDNGVITYFFLSNRRCFRLAPPLTISHEEIKSACAIINRSINNVVNE